MPRGVLDQKRTDQPPRTRGRGFRFALLFVLMIGAFYIFTQLGVFQNLIGPASMRLSAHSASPVIRALGDPVVVIGTGLESANGRVDVLFGCDALEPIVYLGAAIIAFPSTWRRRLIGIAFGIPFLFLLNIIRITSLYYIATRRPGWFDLAHRDVWQPLFIICTLAVWFAWAMLLHRPKPPVLPAT